MTWPEKLVWSMREIVARWHSPVEFISLSHAMFLFRRFVTKMMDRHGDDFAAMARDPDNIFQLTENKIRRKVTKFINVPEQFEPFAKERGLLDDAKKILDGEEDAS